MPVALPTFVDGEVLTAFQLNQLVSAVNALEGAILTPAIGFPWVISTISGSRKMAIRHAAANGFVHLYYEFKGGSGDDVRLNLYHQAAPSTAVEIFRDGSPNQQAYKQIIDLTSRSMVVGELYTLELVWVNGGANSFECSLIAANGWGAAL